MLLFSIERCESRTKETKQKAPPAAWEEEKEEESKHSEPCRPLHSAEKTRFQLCRDIIGFVITSSSTSSSSPILNNGSGGFSNFSDFFSWAGAVLDSAIFSSFFGSDVDAESPFRGLSHLDTIFGCVTSDEFLFFGDEWTALSVDFSFSSCGVSGALRSVATGFAGC